MSELYTLPDGWEWKKLGDICDSVQGIQLVKKEQISELKNGYIRYLYISDFSSDKNIIYVEDKYHNKIVNENEYVIVNTGATAGRIFNGKKGVLSNNLFKITNFRNIIDKYFYFYYLNLYQNIIINELKQSTQPHLGHKAFNGYNIPLPPLEEQKRIVAKLDNLFAKIDKAIALHQKNIDEANVFMASVLNDIFVELEEKYEKNTIGNVSTVLNGRAYKQAELLENGKYKVLRVGNFFTNNNWYYSDLELDENKYCDNGDLLYAWSASFGPKIWSGEKVIYHYHIWKILPSDRITKEFLYHYLDFDVTKIKSEFGSGTTMIHITKGSMENRNIPIPPLNIQQKVVSYLDEISQKMEKIKQIQKEKMQSLKALKASILDQAFRGEL